MSIIKWAAILLIAFAPVATEAADKPLQHFTPTGSWATDFGDKSCRLIRNFSDGNSQLTLAFERFGLEPELQLRLTSNAIHRNAHDSSSVMLSYGGDAEPSGAPYIAELADGRTAFLISRAVMIDPARYLKMKNAASSANELPEMLRADLDAAAHVSTITISQGFDSKILIDIGPMTEPVQAMQRCTNDLVARWGIDVPRLLAASKAATPANNFRDWVTPADYPRMAAAFGLGGRVGARLIIGENGKIEKCTVDFARNADFETAVCSSLASRAKFKPALDASGKPMRSYWRATWAFAMPD